MENLKSDNTKKNFNLNSLIPLSLEYYDKNKKEYNEFIKNIDKIERIQTDKDMEKNKIIFYNKKNKVLLESEYEIIGIFYKKFNAWIWSWAMPTLKKNEVMISRKLLNYALDIDINREENSQFRYIKTELITSRTRVTNKLQLDIYLALVSYLSKKKFIYKRRFHLSDEPNNYIDYYLFIINDKIN